MPSATHPRWGMVACLVLTTLVVTMLLLSSAPVHTPALHAAAGSSSSHSVHIDAEATTTASYVAASGDWCTGETRAIATVGACAAAAAAVGLLPTPAVRLVDSTMLPAGCYFKRELPTYYRNWLNHSAAEMNATADRLFFNIGRDPLGPAPPPPPAGNKSARVALCRVSTACAVDTQGRSCDDWIRELPQHRLSCPLLEAYGHDCVGCVCIAGVPSACDDPRLHCRHDKALRRPVSHYSAVANAAGTAIMRSARVVAIGDTHGQHDRVGAIPPGDVLIHTGDFVSGASRDLDTIKSEAAAFNAWLGRLPHRRKFFVAGNHDTDGGLSFEDLSKLVPNAVQLLDTREEVDLDGDGEGELVVWGAPWQPQFEGFATYIPSARIAAKWAAIPEGVDIVVTHTPPRGHDDIDERGNAVGCVSLTARLAKVAPALSLFGHIHSGRGAEPADAPVRERIIKATARGTGPTTFANVASMPGLGDTSPPRGAIVFDVPFAA